MTISTAEVPTRNATSYLGQLCRHWGHKFPVQFDDQHWRIELPRAVRSLQANPDHLHVTVESLDAADGPSMLEVVAEHLQRFGYREQLVFDWKHGKQSTVTA